MGTMTWHPKWWNETTHGDAWTRVKDALKRDWEQTKADVSSGGKELNQGVGDTIKQAAGSEAIPPGNQPNTNINTNKTDKPRSWDDVQAPIAYGFGARQQYGKDYNTWNEGLETKLKSEWEQGREATRQGWDDVKGFVKRGFEHTNQKS